LLQKNTKEISSGYFGKLPEFNDFVKFNSGLPEILFIDKWIQEGIANARLKLKSDWKQKYEILPPTNFYIPFSSSERAAAGIIFPSSDKSGREFPIVIFSVIPLKNFERTSLIPAKLTEVLSGLEYHLRKEEDLLSLNMILKNYDAPIPDETTSGKNFQNYLSITTLDQLIKRTNINFSIADFKTLSYTDSTFIRIQLCSDEYRFTFDAGFFIEILNKKINISSRQTSVFWNNSDEGRFRVVIFPFKLNSTSFVDLMSDDNEDKRVIYLGSSIAGTPDEYSGVPLDKLLKII